MVPHVIVMIESYVMALAGIAHAGTAENILVRMETSYGSLQRYIVRQESWTQVRDSQRAEAVWSKQVMEARYDGSNYDATGYERFDILQSEWPNLKTRGEEPAIDQGRHDRLIWDGRMYYANMVYRDNSFRELLRPEMSASRVVEDRHFIPTSGHDGAPLNGYMFGDSISVVAVLRGQASVVVRDERVPVNGADCLVIDASGKHGQYTLWIDPDHGFLVAKAEVRKGPGNIFYKTPLARPRKATKARVSSLSWSMSNAEFECVEGIWIAVACECKSQIEFGDHERTVEEALFVRRPCVALNPDFSAVGAFVPAIPDGTRIRLSETPGLTHQWLGGKLIPYYDPRLVAEIERCLVPGREFEVGPMPKSENSVYCGLYSLYAAARRQSVDVNFIQLLKPAYVSTRCGSSIADLNQAAADIGMYSFAVSQMSPNELRRCSCPVLLLVKSSLASLYKHWVLYLGQDGGEARVLDPSHSMRRCSFGELVTFWKGDALVVSATPVNPKAILGPRRRHLLLGVIAVVIAVVLVRALGQHLLVVSKGSRVLGLGISVLQAGSLLAATTVGAGLFHYLNRDGVFANTRGVRLVQQANAATFIPHIATRRLNRLLADGAVPIDARFAVDFKRGHLDGAINIPADANDVQRQAKLSEVPKNTSIVVYCQSSRCAFAERIALALIADGFSDVVVYRGGWMEWQVKHGGDRDTVGKDGNHEI